jgi:NAD(P)-dependent dehydrogenase (short-subunit alcohol dehydrogenase family)
MLEDNPTLDNKLPCALVTGAGRGIGAAVARALAKAGHPVALVARSGHELERQVRAIEGYGGRALAIAADLRESGAASRAVEAARREFGDPGVVVSNAATVHTVQPLLDSDERQWWATFEVNVRAAAELLRAVLPAMLMQGGGRVVGVSSLLAGLPLPGVSAYCASKSAFEALHLSVAPEVAARGVHINTLWPGVVDTVMQAEIRHEPISVVGNRGSDAHMRTPDEVADVVLALIQPTCLATGLRIDLDNPETLRAAGLSSLAPSVASVVS